MKPDDTLKADNDLNRLPRPHAVIPAIARYTLPLGRRR
jgi:hypothetical protein